MTNLNPHTVLLDKTFAEANALLLEARGYVKWQAPVDAEELSPLSRLKVSCESMRVTARLTQVMAWLMLQKAVQGGEVTLKEANNEALHVLNSQTCLDNESETDNDIPPRLRILLHDSLNLYLRIMRLDAQCRKAQLGPSEIKKLTAPRH